MKHLTQALGFVAVVGIVSTVSLSLTATDTIAQVRAALVRDLDSPVRGVRSSVNTSFVFPADQFTMIHTVSPFIPLGKKLVVQSLSFQMYLTDDRIPTEVNATIGDPAQGARFYVRMDLQGEGGDQKRFTGNVAPNVAMGQGEDIRLEFWRNDDGGVPAANFVRVAVVGYLVDAGV